MTSVGKKTYAKNPGWHSLFKLSVMGSWCPNHNNRFLVHITFVFYSNMLLKTSRNTFPFQQQILLLRRARKLRTFSFRDMEIHRMMFEDFLVRGGPETARLFEIGLS